MSTTGSLGILLTAFLAGTCTPPSTPPAEKTPPPAARPETATVEAGADIRGTITRLTTEAGRPGPRILIEGTKEADTHWDRGWVQITPETRVLKREEQENRPAKPGDLAVGQTVEARFTGAIAKSLPLQATAKEIVILGSGSPVADAQDEPGDTSAADFLGTAGIVEKSRADLRPVTLREVRTALHPGFDRIVFEFAGAELPGYHLEYIDKPVRQCASGEVVSIAGDGWLQVRLVPAQAHTESGEPTIGERERRLDYPVLRELESTCDFEGHVEWVLGVASPNRYRALELAGPPRLVVDVRH